MSRVIKESTVEKIKGIKSVFRQIALWTFIAGIILGGIFIMIGGVNTLTDIIGKIIAMFFFMAIAMLIASININHLSSENAGSQVFAVIGLIVDAVCFVLWILALWVGETFLWSYNPAHLNMLGAFSVTFAILNGFFLIASCTMAMYEGGKKNIIVPMKIVSIACLSIVCIHGITNAFTSVAANDPCEPGDRYAYCAMGDLLDSFVPQNEFLARFAILASFSSFFWLVTLIIAGVNASGERNKIAKAEKQARIQAKVAEQQAAMMEQAKAAVRAEMAQEEAAKAEEKEAKK